MSNPALDVVLPFMQQALSSARGIVVLASDPRIAISRMQAVHYKPEYAGQFAALRYRVGPDDPQEVWIVRTTRDEEDNSNAT